MEWAAQIKIVSNIYSHLDKLSLSPTITKEYGSGDFINYIFVIMLINCGIFRYCLNVSCVTERAYVHATRLAYTANDPLNVTKNYHFHQDKHCNFIVNY